MGKLALDKCALNFLFYEHEGKRDRLTIFSILESLKRD
jgi:hypothetical protein